MTPTGARSLAYWLSATSPSIYAELLRRATAARSLGALGCDCRRFGALGQDDERDFSDLSDTTDDSVPEVTATDALQEVDVIADVGGIAADNPALESEFPTLFDTVDPSSLESVTVNAADVPLSTTDTVTADNTPPASTTSSALSAVGSYLASPAGVSAVLQVGKAALQASAAASNAQTAQTVLQAQVARTVAGGNPAAISYQVDPATGQLTPVLATTAGATPVTAPLLSALAPNAATLQLTAFLSQYGIWVAAGLVLLLISKEG